MTNDQLAKMEVHVIRELMRERDAARARVAELEIELALQHNIIQAALDFTSSGEAGEEDVRGLENAVGEWCQAQIDKMEVKVTP